MSKRTWSPGKDGRELLREVKRSANTNDAALAMHQFFIAVGKYEKTTKTDKTRRILREAMRIRRSEEHNVCQLLQYLCTKLGSGNFDMLMRLHVCAERSISTVCVPASPELLLMIYALSFAGEAD